MAQYEYEIVNVNFSSWILNWKILRGLGLFFDNNDVISGMSWNSSHISIHTYRDLTAPEKAILDGIMIDSTSGNLPDPTGCTIFEVQDVVDRARQLELNTSLTTRFINWVPAPRPKNGQYDKIEIWIEGNLTTPQVNNVKTFYGNLITKK